jgi:hypothetical protein
VPRKAQRLVDKPECRGHAGGRGREIPIISLLETSLGKVIKKTVRHVRMAKGRAGNAS